MKASYRFLSLFLVLALMFSCSACASGTGTAAGAEEAGQEAIGEEAAGEGLSAVETTLRLCPKALRSLCSVTAAAILWKAYFTERMRERTLS